MQTQLLSKSSGVPAKQISPKVMVRRVGLGPIGTPNPKTWLWPKNKWKPCGKLWAVLSEKQRTVFLLRFVEDLDLMEIAPE